MSPTAVLFDVDTRTIYIRHYEILKSITMNVCRALGWLLEEIHVTWAHLEKKRTRLRLYTKSLEELFIQCVETTSRIPSDGVRDLATASERSRLKKALEESTW
ncbi:hypothetical protein Tco_0305261 [Tanacetum coccineum]